MVAVETLVSGQGLQVVFGGGLRALEAVELEIPRGQFVSIVGPSGCGKSTLLRLIAGLLRPTAGKISLAGRDPAEARQTSLSLAVVFQDPTLLAWRTTSGNVDLPLELASISRRSRMPRVRHAIQQVGLEGFENSFPDQLSGGMRMRVSLARALVTRPDLLLLDEPFAALDDLTRFALNEELLALWRSGEFTAVFVTHNISEAVFLSQRVLVMSSRPGRVVADIRIPLDMPRTAELRMAPEFASFAGQVAAALRDSAT